MSQPTQEPPGTHEVVQTIEWCADEGGGFARLIDQTRLPSETVYLDVRDVDTMVDAIRRLVVRGAPAIGVAAAYGLCLGVQPPRDETPDALLERARAVAARLAASRPTAVNLFWALERVLESVGQLAREGASAEELHARLLQEAHAIAAEDREQCRRMGELGAQLIPDAGTVYTHCNAGALATAGLGTALAPMYVAHERGKRLRVFAGETRPLLQGARLTAWELGRAGIDVTVVADSVAASLMQAGRIDAVFVGADRIARNGDVCNKIGTYGLAVQAHHHGVPFYVVAPLSTFDPEIASGRDIPIEERAAEEVAEGFGPRTTPEGIGVQNPAFDVTPAALVSAIVTEAGVLEAPSLQGVEGLLRTAGRIA